MARAGAHPGLHRAEAGTVYAEFIMAFTPFFLLFLGTIQVAFIATGGLIVQTAAVKAVRAASVVLDDDPAFYKGEERRLLDFNGNTEDDGWINDVGGQMSSGGAPWLVYQGSGDRVNQIGELKGKGGPRLRAIRRAAYMPLAALGPEWQTFQAWFDSVISLAGDANPESRYSLAKTAIGTSPAVRFVMGFLAWNPIGAAINFPTAAESDTLRNAGEDFNGEVRYGLDDKVTVRVTYLFPCGVPIANLLVCKSLIGMTGIEDSIEDVRELLDDPSLSDLINIRDRMREIYDRQRDALNEAQRNFDEMQAGAEYPEFQYALFLASGARFHVLRREATLPIQGAPYCYPHECPDPKPPAE